MSSRHHTSHRTAIPTGSNPKAIIIIPLHVSVSESNPVLRHGGPHHRALILQASAAGPRASELSPPALIVRSGSIPATVQTTMRTACRSAGRVKTVTEAKVCGHSDNAPDHRIVRRSFNLHPVAGTAGPPPATPAGRHECKFNNHNDLRAVRIDTSPPARGAEAPRKKPTGLSRRALVNGTSPVDRAFDVRRLHTGAARDRHHPPRSPCSGPAGRPGHSLR